MTSIHVPILTRVEGEGALELTIANHQISNLQLRIYEPPRLFEQLLQQRSYDDALDFVARICGICPVAYQMTAAQALENIFDCQLSDWIRNMRRVFYCGEWIESHSMHIHLLAIPDYFGFSSATDMAKQYPNEIRRGLRLQALGNLLIELFGARSVHPVGARVGGFYHAPTEHTVKDIVERLQQGVEDTVALVQWVASLDFPNYQNEFICVALQNDNEYAILEGHIVSSTGLRINASQFANYFREFQVPYSTALHCLFNNNNYLVGPLARVNLNHAHLPKATYQLLQSTGIHFPSYNMFHSIVARAIEIHFALTEAIRLLHAYTATIQPYVAIEQRGGIGFGCTEAPRGLLWHRYEVDENGKVLDARIVPPTSQNQARIEDDLRHTLTLVGLDKSEHELRQLSEKIIRNYDPCISCSTHFLDLRVHRT